MGPDWQLSFVFRVPAMICHEEIIQLANTVISDLKKVSSRALSVVVAAGSSGDGVSFAEGAVKVARQGTSSSLCAGPYFARNSGFRHVFTSFLRRCTMSWHRPCFPSCSSVPTACLAPTVGHRARHRQPAVQRRVVHTAVPIPAVRCALLQRLPAADRRQREGDPHPVNVHGVLWRDVHHV